MSIDKLFQNTAQSALGGQSGYADPLMQLFAAQDVSIADGTRAGIIPADGQEFSEMIVPTHPEASVESPEMVMNQSDIEPSEQMDDLKLDAKDSPLSGEKPLNSTSVESLVEDLHMRSLVKKDISIEDIEDSAPQPKKKKDPLVTHFPIMDILSGQMTQVKPAEIGRVILTTPLVQKVLNADDVSNLMNESVTASDFLKMIKTSSPKGSNDADQQLMNALLGENATQTAPIREHFKALGFDPVRAEAELVQLRASIESGDLEAYPLRAARIQGQASKMAPMADFDQTEKQPDADLSEAPVRKEAVEKERVSTSEIPMDTIKATPETQLSSRPTQFNSQANQDQTSGLPTNDMNSRVQSNVQAEPQLKTDMLQKDAVKSFEYTPEVTQNAAVNSEAKTQVRHEHWADNLAEEIESIQNQSTTVLEEDPSQNGASQEQATDDEPSREHGAKPQDLNTQFTLGQETQEIKLDGVQEPSAVSQTNSTELEGSVSWNRQEAIESIQDQVQALKISGGGQVNFMLNDQDAGRIGVSIDVSGNGVDIHLQTADDSMREKLQNDSEALRNSLEQSDLVLGELRVDTAQDGFGEGKERQESDESSLQDSSNEHSSQSEENTRGRDGMFGSEQQRRDTRMKSRMGLGNMRTNRSIAAAQISRMRNAAMPQNSSLQVMA